jgi:hypothetical protein
MIAAIAVALLLAAVRGAKSAAITLLAVASAAGLAAIDVIYVSRGVIAPVYLAECGGRSPALTWLGDRYGSTPVRGI